MLKIRSSLCDDDGDEVVPGVSGVTGLHGSLREMPMEEISVSKRRGMGLFSIEAKDAFT
jgi:hypothetical protein